jgi:hypothetical protein
MSQTSIDDQIRIATFERISRYTVGIAADKNTGVGTGTLVSIAGDRCVLTAAHVIGDSKQDALRFWLRPGPIIEKAAHSTTDAEVGGYTAGVQLPIIDASINLTTDVAILKLDSSFRLPESAEFYDISNSHEFLAWPKHRVDGVSLFLFGFPTDNSRPVGTVGNNTFYFLGCASLVSEYSADLNSTAWARLPSAVSPDKDFVFKYGAYSENIGPRGFSGGGVWVFAYDPKQMIWRPDPLLIGVTHSHFAKSGLLAATKLSAIIEVAAN